jgi:pilus assembly protein Flp/PilA
VRQVPFTDAKRRAGHQGIKIEISLTVIELAEHVERSKDRVTAALDRLATRFDDFRSEVSAKLSAINTSLAFVKWAGTLLAGAAIGALGVSATVAPGVASKQRWSMFRLPVRHPGLRVCVIELKARTSSISDLLLFSEKTTMSHAVRLVSRFLVSEDGPAAVEYAVLMGLIIVALVGVVGSLAQSISGTFSTVSSTLGAGS